MKDDQESFESS